MSLEVTKEFLEQVKSLITSGDRDEIRLLLSDQHPADIAELLDEISSDDAQYVYHLLDKDLSAEVMVELEEDVREKLLEPLSPEEIAHHVIDRIESDDAADVISELPDDKQEEVIALIEDEEQASDIIDLLHYKEGTAGALMAKEMVVVDFNWTVANCIREMRKQAEKIEQVYTIYVVDDHDTLLGRLSLKDLLFSASSTRARVADIYSREQLTTVLPDTSEEEVAKLMEKYNLISIPVVSEAGVLLGRITIDDIVDVIMDEAEKDYQLASGIAEDVESKDNIWTLTRARLPWLLIGMAGGILGASVIGVFNIEENPQMALFIPLIAAMGGNVGVQSAAIVVQGLANKSVMTNSIVSMLVKELGVGLVNGVICALLLMATSLILNFGVALTFTISLSLIAVIVFAAVFGTFVPLALDKYKIDPALATGPFVTTVNDIFGLIIYFTVGKILLAEVEGSASISQFLESLSFYI